MNKKQKSLNEYSAWKPKKIKMECYNFMNKKQASLWNELNEEEKRKIARIERARKEKDIGFFENYFGIGEKLVSGKKQIEKIKMESLGRVKSNKSDFL